MSKNSEIIEDFKKSLSATIKSIGKKEDLEINFVKENPSIIGNTINLTEPKICLLYTSPSPRDKRQSRMPSSA